MQHAVDPVADDEAVLEGLDVDVGRAGVERVGDDERDEPDDRRLGGQVLQLLDVGIEGEIVAALLDVADDLADRRAAGAVQPLQRGVELGRDRDLRLHLAAGDHPERADGIGVGRVDHRERELVLVLLQRQRAGLAQEPCGNAFFENREFRISGGVDQRQPELRRECLGDVALRTDAERHQQRADFFAAFLLHAQRAFESGGVQLAAFDQDLAEPFANRCVHAWNRSGSRKGAFDSSMANMRK